MKYFIIMDLHPKITMDYTTWQLSEDFNRPLVADCNDSPPPPPPPSSIVLHTFTSLYALYFVHCSVCQVAIYLLPPQVCNKRLHWQLVLCLLWDSSLTPAVHVGEPVLSSQSDTTGFETETLTQLFVGLLRSQHVMFPLIFNQCSALRLHRLPHQMYFCQSNIPITWNVKCRQELWINASRSSSATALISICVWCCVM